MLVGIDGRVRVSDFGLARNPMRSKMLAPDALETLAGGLVGTPSYMSPEQWKGQPADARSDQYSFGVALFEALVGRHPFPNRTVDALRTAALSGAPATLPSELPRRLRSVLGRALASNPDNRYPTMDALVRDLDAGRTSLLRRLLPATALLAGAGLFTGAVLVAWPRGPQPSKPPPVACAKAADNLDGVWNTSIAARVAEKLPRESTALASLEQFANDWRRMRIDVCEAALRKELSEELRDRRNACLDRRLLALDGAVKVISKGDRDPSGVLRGLPAVADCADQERVESSIFLPSDPDDRKKVDAIETDLEQARAYTNANQILEAGPLVTRALDAAKALGFDPILAEAQFRNASLLEDSDDYPGAEKAYRDAFATARASRDDEVMRATAIALVRVIGTDERRPADADEWIKAARAEVKRADTDVSAKARLIQNEADVDLTAGRYGDAKTKLEEVVRIREASLDPKDPDVAISHANLGAAQERLGDYESALVERKKAFDLIRAIYGEDTPIATTYARGVADIEYRLGRYEEARVAYERALDTYRRFSGVDAEVSTTHEALARVLRALKDPTRAVSEMEAAIAIREKLVGPEHPFVAGQLKNLADALADAGRSTEALAALDRATTIMTKVYGADSPEGADITCARADLSANLGRYDEAISDYQKAIDRVSRAYGATHPEVGRYAFNLGLAEKRKGDLVRAAAAYELSLHAFEASYGDDARQTKLARAALDAVKKPTSK